MRSQRDLPRDLEAERAVLGTLLTRGDKLDEVREIGIEARDFYLEAHQRLFETMVGLADKHLPIDAVTVPSALKDKGWFDVVGGNATITSLFDNAFQYANVVHYAKIVHEKAMQRRVIDACAEIISQGFAGIEDTEEFINQAESKIFEVSQTQSNQGFTALQNVIADNINHIQKLFTSGAKEVVGLETGFTDFDRMTTGLHPGQVMVLAARPGMGKTSWFISALLHSSIAQDNVAALFSLEMGKEELGFRFLSSLLRLDSRRLKTGQISREEFRRFLESSTQLNQARIHIDDRGSITVNEIRSRCRRLKSKEGRLDLIVVDYLQLMGTADGSGSKKPREQQIAEISRGLKQLAKELGVPIIALSQLSRQVESRPDKRPMLSDLRESGSIEQDADLVCFIYRDDYYNKESDKKGIAELIVAKNRNGQPDTVELAWLGQYTLFANLSPEQQMQSRKTQSFEGNA